MNDILLSPEEIAEFDTSTAHEWDSWPLSEKRKRPFPEYRDLVLCRAQVRKAEAWASDNWEQMTEAKCPDGRVEDVDCKDFLCCRDCWFDYTMAALKAAGEGK